MTSWGAQSPTTALLRLGRCRWLRQGLLARLQARCSLMALRPVVRLWQEEQLARYHWPGLELVHRPQLLLQPGLCRWPVQQAGLPMLLGQLQEALR